MQSIGIIQMAHMRAEPPYLQNGFHCRLPVGSLPGREVRMNFDAPTISSALQIGLGEEVNR